MPKEKRMPYVLYDFISEDMWKKFVEEHTTDDFKEISEKARQSQSFNEYPHHLGAKSYGEMNIVWRRKGYIPTTSSASSTSSCSSVVSSLPDRTYAWLLARSIEDDKGNPYLPDEKTREVKESIDNWRKQQAEGNFVPNRHDDILSRALGKKDRKGRAITFGSGIGIKVVWGSGERRSGRRGREFRDDELEELEARVARRVQEETMQEMDSKMDSMVQEKFMLFAKQIGIQIPTEMIEMNNIGRTTQQNPSSCQSVGDDPFANIQEPVPCRLSLLKNDSEKVIVAEGTYHPELILDHHSNLLPDHVRVSVDDFFDEFKEFSVPVPSSVIKKLKHAHGTFTQWPKYLVSLMHDKEFISNKNNGNNKAAKENMQDKMKVVESGRETKESNTNSKKVFLMDYALENLSQKCGSLNSLLSSLPEGETIKVKADAWTFSYEDSKDIIIKREDVNQLFTGAWLNILVLQVFMMALSDLLDTEEVASIGFMCPEMISETYLHSDADRILLYMTHVMEKQKSKQFILCPYHEKYKL